MMGMNLFLQCHPITVRISITTYSFYDSMRRVKEDQVSQHNIIAPFPNNYELIEEPLRVILMERDG